MVGAALAMHKRPRRGSRVSVAPAQFKLQNDRVVLTLTEERAKALKKASTIANRICNEHCEHNCDCGKEAAIEIRDEIDALRTARSSPAPGSDEQPTAGRENEGERAR